MQYLQCISSGDIVILHYSMDMHERPKLVNHFSRQMSQHPPQNFDEKCKCKFLSVAEMAFIRLSLTMFSHIRCRRFYNFSLKFREIFSDLFHTCTWLILGKAILQFHIIIRLFPSQASYYCRGSWNSDLKVFEHATSNCTCINNPRTGTHTHIFGHIRWYNVFSLWDILQ